jgi:hypothetical protein
MQTEPFCYFGLLKAPKVLPQLISLLPEKERTEIQARLTELQALPPAEILSRWRQYREKEQAAARQMADLKARGRLDQLPPLWQRRILEMVRNGSGR